MKKYLKYIVPLFILVAFAAVSGIIQFSQKVESLKDINPDFSMTANELFDAFDKDENSASLKYNNKIIEVRGEIDRIKITDSLSNIVLSAENALAGGINCSFLEGVGQAQKGDEIKIKGKCQGFLLDVILNNCYVEN